MFYQLLLIKHSIHIPHINRSFYLFQLKTFLSCKSELITKPVAPLSNKVSTVIPSCISILVSPIFTMTSLNDSPLSIFHISTSLSFFSFFSSFFLFFSLSSLKIVFLSFLISPLLCSPVRHGSYQEVKAYEVGLEMLLYVEFIHSKYMSLW